MSNTNIQQSYESVRKFNLIAGSVKEASVNSQVRFIEEELEETVEALYSGDSVGLLDGACDLFVTVAGLMLKLESKGFNVEEALARVCENNLSKFPLTVSMKEADPADAELIPQGAVAHSTPYGYTVFKRESDNKVMKPTNFIPVDLAGLAPEGFFE
jgi:hypothetical protein